MRERTNASFNHVIRISCSLAWYAATRRNISFVGGEIVRYILFYCFFSLVHLNYGSYESKWFNSIFTHHYLVSTSSSRSYLTSSPNKKNADIEYVFTTIAQISYNPPFLAPERSHSLLAYAQHLYLVFKFKGATETNHQIISLLHQDGWVQRVHWGLELIARALYPEQLCLWRSIRRPARGSACP